MHRLLQDRQIVGPFGDQLRVGVAGQPPPVRPAALAGRAGRGEWAVSEYEGPIPIPDDDSRDFWEGCKRHELIFKRCDDCGFYIHLPKSRCPECWSTNVGTARVSGKGTVYTVTIVSIPTAPGFDPPYNVSLVELDEQPGLRVMTNVVDCPEEELEIGLRVEVTFRDIIADGKLEASLPLFRPMTGEGG